MMVTVTEVSQELSGDFRCVVGTERGGRFVCLTPIFSHGERIHVRLKDGRVDRLDANGERLILYPIWIAKPAPWPED